MTIYIADKFAELEKLLQTIEEIPALNILGPLEIQSGGFYIQIGSIIKEEMFIFSRHLLFPISDFLFSYSEILFYKPAI